jgi:hypothetical protein
MSGLWRGSETQDWTFGNKKTFKKEQDVMKLNTRALFQVGSIGCTQKIAGPDGVEARSEARLAYITESSVAAARNLSARDPSFAPGDGDPDVSYGSAVVVSRDAEGVSEGKVLTPGEEAPYFIEVDGKEFSLSGRDMLSLREHMIEATRTGETLSVDARHALSGIQEIFEMVASAPDTERFPAHLIAQAYQAAMIDSFGDFELPISDEEFASKSRGDLLRARIGMLDPAHPDGIESARPLRDLLSESGIQVSESGVGAEIRSATARQITEEAIRRTVLANDRMCREVFGAITGTPIEKLSAAMIPLSGMDRLRKNKSNRRLSGDWIAKATETAKQITQGGMPGYKFELDVFSEGGRDILAISDNVGQKNDVAFIYSWPTADRVPVMEIKSGRILNVSPEEVPDEAELERLSGVLGQLEAVNIHDPDGDFERGRFDH